MKRFKAGDMVVCTHIYHNHGTNYVGRMFTIRDGPHLVGSTYFYNMTGHQSMYVDQLESFDGLNKEIYDYVQRELST